MSYLIAILSCIIILGLMITFKKCIKSKKVLEILNKYTIPILLVITFIVRLLCYEAKIDGYIGLKNSPLNNSFLTVISLLAIWFNYTAVLLIISRAFYYFKTLKILTKIFTGPVFILNICLLKPILILLQGHAGTSVLSIVLPIELGIGLGMYIYYWLIDYKDSMKIKDILKALGILCLMLLPAMPAYIPQFIFGYVKASLMVKEITFIHRIFIYGNFIIPVSIYFGLKKQSEDVIRFSLIYISLAVLIVFMVNFNYTNLSQPWTWPFHLCNTALFIIPLCLIFKMKRLFYFTYFINVVGALIAMLMPNYDVSTNILSSRIMVFWANHYIAFFMPILAVGLNQFERPKLKQFIYSMAGFLAYFILVLVLNVWFSAIGHQVDYFFINSNYVADQLGDWAEKIFNISLNINVGGYNLEFHPVYQVAFFIVYILIGLGVWFVYEEGYRVTDRFNELSIKLKKIKLEEYALKSTLNGREIDQPMNPDAGTKLELKHFSKRYGNNKHYAVSDANLEVYGGEIFGFLGPNGAGKSTIIKSTVGIQPISEGKIEVCGYDVATQSVAAKSQIGYVPDHYALYEKLTGREYINYIADIYEVSLEKRNERLEKYIKLFELEQAIDNRIESYSHGMKQKITIMAALVHEPKVWILDEPLTGLDPNSIYQVKECMKEHAGKGNIVFFSSHIIDIVEKLCERIAIIKKGEIKCVRSVKEIEESGQSLEQFYLEIINNKDEN